MILGLKYLFSGKWHQSNFWKNCLFLNCLPRSLSRWFTMLAMGAIKQDLKSTPGALLQVPRNPWLQSHDTFKEAGILLEQSQKDSVLSAQRFYPFDAISHKMISVWIILFNYMWFHLLLPTVNHWFWKRPWHWHYHHPLLGNLWKMFNEYQLSSQVWWRVSSKSHTRLVSF